MKSSLPTIALVGLIAFTPVTQASWVTGHLTKTWSELVSFFSPPQFPVNPGLGDSAEESWGAQVFTHYLQTQISYDTDFYYIDTRSSYHDEWAPVGYRQWQYVGSYDPDTNALNASWVVVAENVLDTQFFVGSSEQFLQSKSSNGDPEPVIALPAMWIPFTAIISAGFWRKRKPLLIDIQLN